MTPLQVLRLIIRSLRHETNAILSGDSTMRQQAIRTLATDFIIGVGLHAGITVTSRGAMAVAESLAPTVSRLGMWGEQRVSAGGFSSRNSLAGQRGSVGVSEQRTIYKFKRGEDIIHFEKHGKHLVEKLDLRSGYNVEQYIRDANHVISDGIYVSELHAYVKIPTGIGKAEAPFVGLDRVTNEITTFHMKSISILEKKAPSLGWSAKPVSEKSDLIGLNQESGWKSPYMRVNQ